MAIKTKNGIKLYPAARWETSAHKIEYFLVKAENKLNDWYFTGKELSEREYEKVEQEIEYLRDLMERFVPDEGDGLVYLPYPDYKRVKEMIAQYDARH